VSLALIAQGKIDLLGGDDFGLAFLLVEEGVIQRFAFVENGNLSVLVLANGDRPFVEGVGRTIGLDLVDHLLELEGQVFGEGAGLLPGQDLIQILVAGQGAMGVERTAGGDGKASVEICPKV